MFYRRNQRQPFSGGCNKHMVSYLKQTGINASQYRFSHCLEHTLSVHGDIRRTCHIIRYGKEKDINNIVRTAITGKFFMEHPVFLFPEPFARIYRHTLVGYFCHLIYNPKFPVSKGKFHFIHPLRSMGLFCNLS